MASVLGEPITFPNSGRTAPNRFLKVSIEFELFDTR